MRAKYLILTVFVLLIGVLLGRGVQSYKPVDEGAKAFSGHFAMNVVVSGVPFWLDAKETWEKVQNVLPGVTTEFGGPLGTDPAQQIEEIGTLVRKKVSGIVIAPTDSKSLTPAIDQAVASGIPVVTVFNDVPASKRLTFITSPREAASEQVMTYLSSLRGALSGKAIILFSHVGSEEQERRALGFKNFIAAHPSLTLVDVVEDRFDENRGSEGVAALLAREKDIKFIFGSNSRSAVGAVSALREAHKKPGEVIVTGWDYDEDTLSLIDQGWVSVTVAQQSVFVTQLAFNILLAHHLNYLYPQSLPFAVNGVRPLPERIEVPVILVTKENTKAFFRRK